mmetsp:Transcript_20527/g.63446  ORF Transcript_20527/g.63446 Transcript_20527/m.63446 type:complete len:260 (+) Transcript_20527:1460-2239(+)
MGFHVLVVDVVFFRSVGPARRHVASPLFHGDPRLGGDLGRPQRNVRAGLARAAHDDTLPRVRLLRRPELRAVDHVPRKALQPRERPRVGVVRVRARRADHHVEHVCRDVTVRRVRHAPLVLRLRDLGDGRAELDEVAQPELVRELLQVLDVAPERKVPALPHVLRRKARERRVAHVRRVARVVVVVSPVQATAAGLRLEHRHVPHALLQQLLQRDHTARPPADDRHAPRVERPGPRIRHHLSFSSSTWPCRHHQFEKLA